MNPSCSPMMSASVFCPASNTLPPRGDEGLPARRAVILKKGPNTAVSRTKPRAFAAAASSSRVTGGGDDDALARLAARRARRDGTRGAGFHRTTLEENDAAAACCAMPGMARTIPPDSPFPHRTRRQRFFAKGH